MKSGKSAAVARRKEQLSTTALGTTTTMISDWATTESVYEQLKELQTEIREEESRNKRIQAEIAGYTT